MKKILSLTVVAIALLAANTANAQMGVSVGYSSMNTTTHYTSGNLSLNDTSAAMNGIFVGVNYNLELSDGIGLLIGVQGRYNFKNDKKSSSAGTTEVNASQVVVDIPLLVNYGFSLGKGLTLSPFVGVTPTLAFSGKTKTVVTGTPLGLLDGESTTDWYGDGSKRKKLDVALTFGACLNFNGFRIYGGYNLGMLNQTSADNTTIKNQGYFAGVGLAL